MSSYIHTKDSEHVDSAVSNKHYFYLLFLPCYYCSIITAGWYTCTDISKRIWACSLWIINSLLRMIFFLRFLCCTKLLPPNSGPRVLLVELYNSWLHNAWETHASLKCHWFSTKVKCFHLMLSQENYSRGWRGFGFWKIHY